MLKRISLQWKIVICVVLGAAFLGAMLWLDLRPRDKIAVSDGFPLLQVYLNNVSLDDINNGEKSEKYDGNEVLLYNGSGTKHFSNVEIKGRGNSTWTQPKKPYQLKFAKRVDILGMGRGKRWVLLADYLDASHLRNDTAFYLEEMLGQEYAMRGRYAEVVIGGNDLGLYYVANRLEISKNSIDLREPLGILVEMDNLHGVDADCCRVGEPICFVVKDVVDDVNKEIATQDFLSAYKRLESAIQDKDYEKISEIIDVESFAKYYLLSEFTVDPDAYTTSWFLYKDGSEDKIHAGPGWDYDLALGNRQWVWTENADFHSPEQKMIRRPEAMSDGEKRDANIARVMYQLLEIPEFQSEVRRVFAERMAGRKAELRQHMLSTAAMISERAVSDNERWGRGDFYAEVDYLLDWVERRYQHFEEEYGDGLENSGVQLH